MAAQPIDDRELITNFYRFYEKGFSYPSFDDEVKKSFEDASTEGVLVRIVEVDRPDVHWDIEKLRREVIYDSGKLKRLYDAAREFIPRYSTIATTAGELQPKGALFHMRDDNGDSLAGAILLAFRREKKDIIEKTYLRPPQEPFVRRFETFRRAIVAEILFVTNDNFERTRDLALRFLYGWEFNNNNAHRDDN